MNYRHHFHAGNFADVMKHGLWLALLGELTRDAAPLQVIDTHAGAGLYGLEGEPAQKSGEAEAGVRRLMAATELSPELMALRAAVAGENSGSSLRHYPGSPLLTLGALRTGDLYEGCEMRPDEQHALCRLLGERGGAAKTQALLADGYAYLESHAPTGRLAVLIDPPFERGDEYDRIVQAVQAALAKDAVLAVWAPLKDLETFDALLRRLEGLRPPSLLAAEVRLRPLLDPLKMNGCAMILIGGPNLEASARRVCAWTAAVCGDAGHGAARVRELIR